MSKENIYTLEVECKNCGCTGVLEIKKGFAFESSNMGDSSRVEGEGLAFCKNCGCARLVKYRTKK